MENKNVGWLIIGIAAIMTIIVLIFNTALKDIVTSNCILIHGDTKTCPMFDTIRTQTGISLGIIGVVVIIGLVIMFQMPKERVIVKPLDTIGDCTMCVLRPRTVLMKKEIINTANPKSVAIM